MGGENLTNDFQDLSVSTWMINLLICFVINEILFSHNIIKMFELSSVINNKL